MRRGYARPKGSKYLNKKVVVDGIEFSSKKEARHYQDLLLLSQSGEISDLRLQVPYELIPAQKEPSSIGSRGGVKPGKTIERACIYVADFVYKDKEGNTVVEDVKGYRGHTGAYSVFVIKRKLMLWKYGIKVREV
jgi:hypothetical protein